VARKRAKQQQQRQRRHQSSQQQRRRRRQQLPKSEGLKAVAAVEAAVLEQI